MWKNPKKKKRNWKKGVAAGETNEKYFTSHNPSKITQIPFKLMYIISSMLIQKEGTFDWSDTFSHYIA